MAWFGLLRSNVTLSDKCYITLKMGLVAAGLTIWPYSFPLPFVYLSFIAFYRIPYACYKIMTTLDFDNFKFSMAIIPLKIWLSQGLFLFCDIFTILLAFIPLLITVHRLKSLFTRLKKTSAEDFFECRTHKIFWNEFYYFGYSWNYNPDES